MTLFNDRDAIDDGANTNVRPEQDQAQFKVIFVSDGN